MIIELLFDSVETSTYLIISYAAIVRKNSDHLSECDRMSQSDLEDVSFYCVDTVGRQRKTYVDISYNKV